MTIAIMNSVHIGINNNKSEVLNYLNDIDVIMVDEGHHSSCDMIKNIILNSDSEYLLSFSGSHFKQDIVMNSYTDALVLGLIGRKISMIPYSKLMDEGLISRPYVFFHYVGADKVRSYEDAFNRIYDRFVLSNEKRNKAIKEYIELFKSFDIPVLILVIRKDHARTILDSVSGLNHIAVFGSNSGVKVINGRLQDIHVDYYEFKKDFEEGKYDVAVMTQVGDEGVDLPNIGAMIMAGGQRSRIKLTQRLGRGIRKKDDEFNRVYIIDFLDKAHVYLQSQSYHRKNFYESNGSVIMKSNNELMNCLIEHHGDTVYQN